MSDGLSPRHVEVLRLIADGLSTREIADRLGMSKKTVENHRTLLFARMGAKNAPHAVALAYQQGVL